MSVFLIVFISLTFATLAGLFVSALHYALGDFSMVKLEQLIEKRGRKEAIDRVLDDIPGHVLATGALRVFCNVIIAIACVVLLNVFSAAESDPVVHISAWRLIVAILASTMLIHVFSVVLPVSIAEHIGERLLYSSIVPVRAMHLFAMPLRFFTVVDTTIKRLAGVAHVSDAEEAEDEILSAVSEGEREGSIGEEEREMIEGVVELRSQTVEEIMTPRTEIEGFELTDDLSFIREYIEKAGHSRIPVFEGDLDHIAGILYAKDLLQYLGKDASEFKLRPLLRKPVWVPETKPLSEMMVELRARRVHLAIVLDEYGGTTGLVTFEDILEEIVGEIEDEFEPESESQPEIKIDEPNASAEVDARAYIDDANEALKTIGIEIPEGEDYDTVGGFVLQTLGHIPIAGEIFEADGFALAVLSAEPTRVTRLRIEARAQAVANGEKPPRPVPHAAAADEPAPK